MKIKQEWIGVGCYNSATYPHEVKSILSAVAPLIRAEALKEAAKVAREGCLVPPDGGSPTQAETDLCDEIERRILALIEPS